MRALAETVAIGGTLLLTIARLEDDVCLVSVQPKAKDANDAALPIQIKGRTADLDAELAEALSIYVPAREYALKTADGDRRTHRCRSREAQDQSADPRHDRIRAHRHHLEAGPAQAQRDDRNDAAKATLKARDTQGKDHDVTANAPTYLPEGQYLVTASAAEHAAKTVTLVVKGEMTVLGIVLPANAPTLL